MVVANAIQVVVLMGASKNENANLTNAQQIVVDSVMNARTVQAAVGHHRRSTLTTHIPELEGQRGRYSDTAEPTCLSDQEDAHKL